MHVKFLHCPPRAAKNAGQGVGAHTDHGHLALLRKVVQALSVGNASTKPQGCDKPACLAEHLPPQAALADLSHRLGGFHPGAHPLDDPLPELPVSHPSQPALQQNYEAPRRDNPIIRDLFRRGANDDRTITDLPPKIADHIEEGFHRRAADGLDVIFAYPPGILDDFAEPVIPEVRRRGPFRAHCTSRPQRDQRDLPRPSRRV
ncbi:alkanesulfonate monooxygenase SsuD/methylene tetrahydromethanopterin reductase-like flavin-dependent oxidoreductase (luciferase family) [Streptomyces sp. SAI-144]|jgi:alkanesulfonate monooxygenase SsuD/methylene tetrahydromethanopterin reductase-like flavin-dependent oxidoreductase (luciferase family)|uniref:hypothetical protein n=1 Tax=Streptomyces sp. SAI-144 TaxID=2940544 RepID=UPI0024766294|nr:hypothetical protein [Streptomyces sp. SAI-144]MDH6436783.1 alkanesulfonate monooxygenase SsuD/methylene tetrahydromethanopterin reductase-like flavin-dependent oxidoreductase (luciferase family) [Streptomyces sp. SAI-144]